MEYLEQLYEVKETINSLKWEFADKKEFQIANRLDTIYGKIEQVESLIGKNKAAG